MVIPGPANAGLFLLVVLCRVADMQRRIDLIFC